MALNVLELFGDFSRLSHDCDYCSRRIFFLTTHEGASTLLMERTLSPFHDGNDLFRRLDGEVDHTAILPHKSNCTVSFGVVDRSYVAVMDHSHSPY